MNLSRIHYLRQELDHEEISAEELAEIEAAFARIQDGDLRDERENATASDMLDELLSRVSPVERTIYNWVEANFGESEALDPSWDIGALAEQINSMEVECGGKKVTIGGLKCTI